MKLRSVLIFFLISTVSFGVDFSGDLKNSLILENLEKERLVNQAKLSATISNMDITGKITIEGNNDSEKLRLYEGYVETYKKDFILTLGKQNLAWGLGYLFNPANGYFLTGDIEDPKEKVEGIDSMKFRYNIGALSRLEILIFENTLDEIDYGIRCTTTIKNWEIMGNYFKKDNDFILEAKGNLGVGIWGIWSSKNNDLVIGEDYSIEIFNRILYIMNENMYLNELDNWVNYLKYSYQWDEILSFSQIFTYSPNKEAYFLNSSANYLINNYMDITIGYSYMNEEFHKISGKILSKDLSLEELKIEISTYF